MSGSIAESLRVLLSGVVDYAGLFPPANLSMAEAVVNYATYANSNYSWMLGRFVCPVARLDEFRENAREVFTGNDGAVWDLTALSSEDLPSTHEKIVAFNRENEGFARIGALEVRTETEDIIDEASELFPADMLLYFEIPIGEDLAVLVSAIAISGHRAKIRTGGVKNELFPETREIVRFIRTCAAANIPFKATAGLHHPIRSFRALTYEPNSPKGTMQGFLNVLLATGFAREGYRPDIIEEILEEEFEEVFEFDGNGVFWQKEHFLNSYQLESLRGKGMNSFGSCSFDEPIADLREIGLL